MCMEQKSDMYIEVKQGVILSSKVPDDVKELFYAYYKSDYSSRNRIEDSYRFAKDLLEFRIPESVSDFNDETFITDSALILKYPNKRHLPGDIKRFYAFLLSKMPENFSVLTPRIINANNTLTNINNGFRFIKRNVNDSVPQMDKWMMIEDEKMYAFDFTGITGSNLRSHLKEYVWYEETPTTETKHSRMGYLAQFCNFLDDAEPVVITYSTISRYKNLLRQTSVKDSSAFVILNGIKDFIRFLDVSSHLDTKGSYIEDAMKMTNANSVPFTDTYTAEETEALITALSEKYRNESNQILQNYFHLICIFALYILNTAIRAGNLEDIRVESLHQSPGGTYYYLGKSKTKSEERYEITNEVKALHDEIINITKPIRDDSTESKYLFVYLRRRGSTVQRLTRFVVSREINATAKSLGYKELGVAGFRNRFMNNITNVILKRGGDPSALIAGVTKHSVAVNYGSYFNGNIVQVCREMYGVTIGDVELKAIVTFTNPDATKENTVMNGRGNCSMATCVDKTKLDCLMCRHCVVTPASIPYFLIEIRDLDERIATATMPEEKEFAIAMKTLNVAYLAKCYEVSAKNGGETHGKPDQHQ